MNTAADIWDDAIQNATVARGLAIYNDTLKAVLEPEFTGQVVAIHLDSGDYAVGRNSSLASRALRARHPEGLSVALDIGVVPMNDPLSLRLRSETAFGGKA